MINELIRDCDIDLAAQPPRLEAVLAGERRALARAITCLQAGTLPDAADQAGAGGRRQPPAASRCSASPAPAAPASRR